MSLRIYLLGQFRCQADDLPLALPSRPAQSLLAYLVVHAGATHRRERLAGLLWPEATEANARRYLRQALWRIRKMLQSASLACEDYLQVNDIEVTFDEQSDYWLDARLLLQGPEAQPVEELIEVARLYRGELLPGFYEEWIVTERHRFQAAYQQKMNLLLEALVQSARWDDVLKWAEQWIRLGHAPEPAYRALMRAYAGLGDSGMVGATYRRCVQALERELGLEPSPETQRLYEEVRRREIGGPAPAPAFSPVTAARRPAFLEGPARVPIETPLFVAREQEVAQLDRFLQSALAGQGRVAFVVGEAGSGKTALVSEFARRAQEAHRELIVAVGNCNAHTGIGDPYLPFREILELLTGDVEARWAAGAISGIHARRLWAVLPLATQALLEAGPDLIDTFVPGPALLERAVLSAPGGAAWLTGLEELVQRRATGSLFPGLQQSNLVAQVTRVLQTIAGSAPLVLLIDDLQWADLGSISLLFHLGRNIAGNRILVAGVYRPEEVAIGRDGERHPLDPVVNEFRRAFGSITVNLGQAAGREFVQALVDSEPNRLGPSFREMLYRQTHGHPLFTIELLRGMQVRGDLLQDEGGRWIEGPALDWETLPARVEAVLAERIGRLPRPMQAALRVACVEGETFTAEVLAWVQASGERQMLECLSADLDRRHRLVRAHRIVRVDGQLLSRYRFRHILFQKHLYGSLDEVERVHLHRQVGKALERLCETPGQRATIALQLARHFQEAGVTEKAIHYLHEAGDRAVQMSAYQEGIAHLGRALTLLMTLPDSLQRDRRELILQLSMGRARMGDVTGPQWIKAINRARELSVQTGETRHLCRTSGELAVFHYVRAEYPQARAVAQEALDLAEQAGDELLVVLGHWYLGFILFGLGEFTAARTHLRHVISFYNPEQHHVPFIRLHGSDPGVAALAYDACCLWCLGYPDRAAQVSNEILALARELNHPFSLADVLCFGGCQLNAMRRDGPALKEAAEELKRISQEVHLPGWTGMGSAYFGAALARLGRMEEGIAEMEPVTPTRHSLGVRCCSSVILAALAEAQAGKGCSQEGLATLAEAFTFVEESGERVWLAELHRLRGGLLLMQNQEVQAEASFQEALEVARQQNARSWELRAATSLARLWQKQGRSEKARRLLAHVHDWFTEGFDTPDLQEARILLDELS